MTHVPTNKTLAAWIRELEAENKLARFYKTAEWRNLRENVLQENHFECRMCADRGIYTRADTVHHVREVRERPELALSRTYLDKDGNECEQLVPLCNRHHNEVHERFGEINFPRKDKFKNVERW